MSNTVTLRGITWNHPRGLDPLLAANDAYASVTPGVQVDWTTRSLSGFGEDPLIELAASYDLLVIDHPFVGDAAASTAFYPLDQLADPAVLAERARASVGPSHSSYDYAGHHWAFAIDAAGQVSAVHERLTNTSMPRTWDDVIELAVGLRSQGLRMTLPMWPADLCCATYTIGKGMGLDLFAGGHVFPRGEGERVLGTLQRLCDLSHPDAWGWNPPTVLDRMRDDVVHYCPILFGYSNYSRPDAPGDHVAFGDIPSATGRPVGACLGGAGIAISTACAHPADAIAYATWITSADVQRGLYFETGGQPGRLEAWVDDQVNAASGDFFRRTLATMENAYVRPRVRGYQQFQKNASDIVVRCMKGEATVATTLEDLDDLWRSVERAATA
jgi:multiple sugar transport system substrate-binding protein